MRRVIAVAAACALCLVVVGCGDSPSGVQLPKERVTSISPPRPQVLAFVAGRRIGVVEGTRIRYLAELERGQRVEQIDWSGDGSQLAWSVGDADESGRSRLQMINVQSGAMHTWRTGFAVANPDPGLRGVVVATYPSRFVEYLPDGSQRTFLVHVPRPADAVAEVQGTSVNAAIPLGRRWLVLAENASTVGRGGPVRAFLFDPQRAELKQVVKGVGIADQPVRLSGDRAIWIEHRSGDACISGDELNAYGISVPALPERSDERSWAVTHLSADHGIDVLARVTGDWTSAHSCNSDRTENWLHLKGGRWIERESGLVGLDVAADGRVARIRGSICEPAQPCPNAAFLGVDPKEATLSTPDGDVLAALPASTTQVRFSPALPAAAAEAKGRGPELSATMRLSLGGFGPLRMGMDPSQLQDATSTPLTIKADSRGCGSVVPTDAGLAKPESTDSP